MDIGFTGQEHVFNLINMNARLYDPQIGSFLSPDNEVSNPESPQNYNRYSYAMNNPLIYTDPSGNFIVEAISMISMWYSAFSMMDAVSHGNNAAGFAFMAGPLIGYGVGALMPAASFLGSVRNSIVSSFISASIFNGGNYSAGDALNSLAWSSGMYGVGQAESYVSEMMLNETQGNTAENGIDVNEVYEAGSSSRAVAVANSKKTGHEWKFYYYRNRKTGDIRVTDPVECIATRGEGDDPKGHGCSIHWDYSPLEEEFIAVEHIHTNNMPLEPYDLNWIGYNGGDGNTNNVYLSGEAPFNDSREMLNMATDHRGNTYYALIKDCNKFQVWYNKYMGRTNYDFNLYEKGQNSQLPFITKRAYTNDEAATFYTEFQRRLNTQKSGVRYGKLP